MTTRVMFDPGTCAELGIDPEATTVVLPDGWERFTQQERQHWARREIEAVVLEMLHDYGAALGLVPTPAQEAAHLAHVRPIIEEALTKGGRS